MNIAHFGDSIKHPRKELEGNEDSFRVGEYDDGSVLVAVADGASDSSQGEVAARSVVDLVHEVYERRRQAGRGLFDAFKKRLAELSRVPENFGLTARCTLTVVRFKISKQGDRIVATYFAAGDSPIVLAQDRPLDEKYPRTFVCYRIFCRPQPFLDSRLFAYVDWEKKTIVGRVIFGEFDLLPGDICLAYTDGVKDEYIQKTANLEHRLLWDIKCRGPHLATTDFMDRIRNEISDDATLVTVCALPSSSSATMPDSACGSQISPSTLESSGNNLDSR